MTLLAAQSSDCGTCRTGLTERRSRSSEGPLILIDPLPSYVWYHDMVDFADGISDRAAGRRLSQALQGRGEFRRFKNQVYDQPELISTWQALRDVRARLRIVQWLADQGLIENSAAERFTSDHPESDLPEAQCTRRRPTGQAPAPGSAIRSLVSR